MYIVATWGAQMNCLLCVLSEFDCRQNRFLINQCLVSTRSFDQYVSKKNSASISELLHSFLASFSRFLGRLMQLVIIHLYTILTSRRDSSPSISIARKKNATCKMPQSYKKNIIERRWSKKKMNSETSIQITENYVPIGAGQEDI